MIKQNILNHTNNLIKLHRDEKVYISQLETYLKNLLRKRPMSFQEIVTHSEGAYPTDVLRVLKNLVLHNEIKIHKELYLIPGWIYKSENNEISRESYIQKLPESAPSIFADPHPADYDWRYTSKAREELINRLGPFIDCESKIALLGAPTLFLDLHKFGTPVTLFDNSPSILHDFESAGITTGLIRHNLFDPLPEFSKKFEVVIADPPWYVPFHEAFILRAAELLKEQGILMLSVPAWLTRPSAIIDRSEIITFATKAGFYLDEIAPGVLPYQCPKFEQIALSLQDIKCGNWRSGDLFVFRKIRRAIRTLRVSCPVDEPSWDEYRFGNLKVKLRKRIIVDSDNLTIKPVSNEGPYLGTVSRRSPLRQCIDLWTSDNIAYSINRVDIVKAALDGLRAGKSPNSIVESFGNSLSKIEADILLETLNSIMNPINLDKLKPDIKSKDQCSPRNSLGHDFNLNKFIADIILPSIKDKFWQERLNTFLLNEHNPNSIHLAVFVEPYLQFVLDGRKTIESRFSSHRCAPYQKVQDGDILLLKRSSGPVVGLCEVTSVWFYHLDPESWKTIKREFAEALCAQDPTFWESRRHASYATLMRIQHVYPITPVNFVKSDRRGWVLLSTNNVQSKMEIENG